MTDERILEELEKALDSDIDDDAFMFGMRYKTERVGKPAGYKNVARGFYAGFRAAERLAKIEVLEETYDAVGEMKDGVYSRDEYDIYDRVQLLMANMLSDLKGEL